jgi:hypothetical protein
MLHLDCPIGADGVLRLAAATTLAPADLPTSATGKGGVVILPNGDYDFPLVADAYLAAGQVAVIGWRRPVPDQVAALSCFLLHSELVDRSRDPAEAVLAVRAWLVNPARVMPAYLPPTYVAAVGAAPAHADALAHRGV